MTNPFDALGLPARPDLTDEQVRDAWRTVAAATHPDRPDGGDLARYTQASAAFAQLRDPWARSEAYADVMEGQPDTDAAAAGPARLRDGPAAAGLPAAAAAPRADLARPPAPPGPARHHRRRAVPGGAGADPRQPPPPRPTCLGLGLWFVLTARSDLAPPPGR